MKQLRKRLGNFWIGQAVRVRGYRRKAIIDYFPGCDGAVVLDREIGGFRWWNVEDLLHWKLQEPAGGA